MQYLFCGVLAENFFSPPSLAFVIYFVSVINSLLSLVQTPEPEHPLRADLAEEYTKDRKKFNKNAQEFTKKNSEPRPKD